MTANKKQVIMENYYCLFCG